MTPSASTSSPPAIATRTSASAGPRPVPTSTAITVRLARPRGAERARVARFGDAILLHDDGDVVASAPAAEAGDVLHGPRGGAHAIRRSRASISRYSERARRTSAA